MCAKNLKRRVRKVEVKRVNVQGIETGFKPGQVSRTLLRLLSAVTVLLVLSLAGGLSMLFKIQTGVNDTIDEVDHWSKDLRAVDSLERSLRRVSEPAVAVFSSRNPKYEVGRHDFEKKYFNRELGALRSEFAKHRDNTVVIKKVDDFAESMERLDLQSDRILQTYAHGGAKAANSLTIALDALNVAAASDLQVLKSTIYEDQRLLLETKQSANNRIKLLGIAMATILSAVVAGLIVFATRFSRVQKVLSTERLKMFASMQRSEADLRAFNRRLTESNRDLTDFAYVASHDLQEPLRKIIAFGDRLGKKFGDQLGTDGMDYLTRMQSAAGRMQTLIDDLLTFSRVTTRGAAFVSTDLNTVVNGVVNDLEVAIERVQATVKVGELPTIDVDPSQFRQLMQNLLGNSLKFRRDSIIPYVSVDASEVDGSTVDGIDVNMSANGKWWAFEVRDNGIGFEQKYADKIFTVFQRLHGRSEYEGSGVGLAVVRRIVERHHGVVTVTSKPDAGTTFTIVVPEQQVPTPDLPNSVDETEQTPPVSPSVLQPTA